VPSGRDGEQLRHVRHALWQTDQIIRAIQQSQPPDHLYTQNLAQAHRILSRQQRRKNNNENAQQLTLL